jgi:GT2 family glycosyltransferase
MNGFLPNLVAQGRRFMEDQWSFITLRYGAEGWRVDAASHGSPLAVFEVSLILFLGLVLSTAFFLVRALIKVLLFPAIFVEHQLIGSKLEVNQPVDDGPKRLEVIIEPENLLVKVGEESVALTDLQPVKRQTLAILLCNYNHGRYVDRAIRAVLTQSRPPDEYFILDDGSTDNSLEVITRHQREFPFIKVIRKTRNEGYLSGIKLLTDMARSDWIHRGASDDYMQPRFIESAMRLAERWPEAGIISGDMTVGQEEEEPDVLVDMPGFETGFISPEKYLHEYLQVNDPMCALVPSSLYRLSVVKELGGWREELGIGDSSFILQAAALKYGMCYLKQPSYAWFYRKAGWTHAECARWRNTLRTCQAYYQLMRSPAFAHLFGTTFPKLWLAGFARQFAANWPVEILDSVVSGDFSLGDDETGALPRAA